MAIHRARIAVLALLAATAGALRAAPAPNVNNAVLAANYERVVTQDLNKDRPDTGRAIAKLTALRAKDPGNALNSYWMAAAYAWDAKWDDALKYLEEGHKAPYCIHFQRYPIPGYWTPGWAPLRELARQAADVAPTLGPEKGGALLESMRRMARRVAGSEPHSGTSLLVAIAVRLIADRASSAVYAGDPVRSATAQKDLAADTSFRDAMRYDFNTKFGDITGDTVAQKYKIPGDQWNAYLRGEPVPNAVKASLEKAAAEVNAKMSAFVLKWLKQMPE